MTNCHLNREPGVIYNFSMLRMRIVQWGLGLSSVRSVDINLTINGDFAITRKTLKLPCSTDVFIPDPFKTRYASDCGVAASKAMFTMQRIAFLADTTSYAV